ncbi:MAG: hypothetical protein KKB50_20170 [Planctomycetes bacterium]|nr:hypothetical protein [Planctomycetota bacterium]
MTLLIGRACGVAMLVALLIAAPLQASWDPDNGDWSKTEETDLRVMTWNVYDTICTTADKTDGWNSWCAAATIVAAMQPDVLILQETGDNGSGVDSVADLTTVMDLFLHGGNDPFNGGTPVTAYVQAYAPAYDLPYIFVSTRTDAYNRNTILSRYPFADLNGDNISEYGDMPFLSPDAYQNGGTGGIRGFQIAEIDLPAPYCGDVVVGNSHLKAGSDTQDKADRLKAAQNIAYLIDYWYNGAGTGTPDPNNKVLDSPAATMILDDDTPVIWGGDWNEDELYNGRK